MKPNVNFHNPVLSELIQIKNLLVALLNSQAQSETKEECFTVKETAQFLKRSPSTIRRWILDGKLEAFKPNHSGNKQDRYLIRKKGLDSFIHKKGA